MAGIKSDEDRREHPPGPRHPPAHTKRRELGQVDRDRARLANSRDSRGPDTGEPLEREVRPPRGVTRHD